MKWSENLHEQLDEVVYRLDARAAGDRLWRTVCATQQCPGGVRAGLKLKSLLEPAPTPADAG